MPVLSARRTAGSSDRDRLSAHPSSKRFSSATANALPTSSRTESIRTSGWTFAQSRCRRRIARIVPTSRLTVFGAASFFDVVFAGSRKRRPANQFLIHTIVLALFGTANLSDCDLQRDPTLFLTEHIIVAMT